MRVGQRLIEIVKFFAEKLLILYDFSQGVETRHIGAVLKPQLEIAIFGILLINVVEGAMPMSFLVELRVIGDSVLYAK